MEMERVEKRVLMSPAWRLVARLALLPWVLRAGELPAQARVLELGSGAGFNAERLLERFPHWRLTATDYDAEMVEMLHRRRAHIGRACRPSCLPTRGTLAMSHSLTCPRCDAAITAEDEDELVTKVEAHVRDDHGATHALSREHILARLRRQGPPGGDSAR